MRLCLVFRMYWAVLVFAPCMCMYFVGSKWGYFGYCDVVSFMLIGHVCNDVAMVLGS